MGRAIWAKAHTWLGAVSILASMTTAQELVAREIDLRNTPDARRIESVLKELAQGNEGDGGINRLILDPDSGEVSGEIWVRHHHEWNYGPHWAPQHQTVYDDTITGSFHYNARNGTGGAVLDFGRGVRFSTQVIEDILAGDVAAIIRDAEAAIPNPGVEIRMRNEYDEIRRNYSKRYGDSNVYFASQRLVDWLSPETAGEYVIAGLVEGGPAAVQQAMNRIQQQSRLEAQDIINWLQQKGLSEAQNVVWMLLSGQRIEWPFMAVKWQTVGYFSQRFVAGRPIGPEIRSTHAAFVLIWSGNQAQRPIPLPQPPGNPQVPSGRTRQFEYVHTNGQVGAYFRLNDGRWINRDGGFTYQFVTQREAADFVDIFDRSRSLTIRLGNAGGQSWTRGNGWNALERGRWVGP